MIFITLGSQKFQFNRLLREIDRLVENSVIKDDVFAQIGYSDYKPKNYNYKLFLDRNEFSEIMDKCDKVITHGGTGAIIGAIKNDKKVIAVPRLRKFGEHVDDHQLQIIKEFVDMGIIEGCFNESELEQVYVKVQCTDYNKYESNTETIIRNIEKFLEE